MKTKSLVETWFKSCGTFWHWILTVEFWQHPSSMPYPEPIYLRLSFRISTLLHPLSMPNWLWPQTKKGLKTSREGDWSFSRKPLFQRMKKKKTWRNNLAQKTHIIFMRFLYSTQHICPTTRLIWIWPRIIYNCFMFFCHSKKYYYTFGLICPHYIWRKRENRYQWIWNVHEYPCMKLHHPSFIHHTPSYESAQWHWPPKGSEDVRKRGSSSSSRTLKL